VLSSGPLHRCVHAGSWALRPARTAAFWWLPKLASGWCCSQPWGGQPSKVSRSEKSILERGRVVRPVCSDSDLWLQKSAGVVGLRKAISVAAEVGGRSLAFWRRAQASEETARPGPPLRGGAVNDLRRVACWQKVSRALEARDLHGSRVKGALVWRLARCLHLASAERQGRQSFGALASVAVKSCYGRGRLSGEAVRVT